MCWCILLRPARCWAKRFSNPIRLPFSIISSVAFDKTLILERWETPCSDAKSLFIVRLVEEKRLTFCVRDEEYEYAFKFESFGPYQIADEAFLEVYQIDMKEHTALADSTKNRLGWTRLVSGSIWEKPFNEGLMHFEYFREGLQHYSI